LNNTFLSVIIDEEQSDKVCHPIHGRPDCVVYPFKKDPRLHCETCWCTTCEVAATKCKFWNFHCKGARKQVKKKAKEAVVANEETTVTVELKKEQAVESKKEKAEKKIEMSVPVASKKEKASNIKMAAALEKEMAAAAVTKKDTARNIGETKTKVAAVKNEKTEVEEAKAIAGQLEDKARSINESEKKMATVNNEETEVEEEKVTAGQLKDYLSSILEMDAATLKGLCKDKGILLNGPATLKHKYAFALFRDALI